jgi:hypothetical protein
MKKRNMITLGIAGGAGVAIYMVYRAQQRTAAAAAMAAAATSSPMPAPSFTDVLFGTIPAAVKGFLDAADALDKTIKARGAAHYAAWRAAVKRGDAYYQVAGKCYATGTGASATLQQCISAGAPGLLEGW